MDRGQEVEYWETKRYFSMCDLVRFSLKSMSLCCCMGKELKKKFLFYKICKATYEDRTDIVNIMKTVADVDSIKEIIFDDHQIRLLPYLGNLKDDTDANIEKMSTDEAVTRLVSNKPHSYPYTKVQMDKYLVKYLPPAILKEEQSSKIQILDHSPDNKKYDFSHLDNFESTHLENNHLPPHLKIGGKRRSLRLAKQNLNGSRRSSKRFMRA